jgi:oligopeptide/dipeptide ABC transporter ATP-binding protein
MKEPLVAARGLVVDYPVAHGRLRALDGVDLALGAGEAVGIVGESGSGKSTLARALLGLVTPVAGTLAWFGRDPARLPARERRRLRRDLQVVFQDPLASLDPRMTVGESVAEPLVVHEPGLAAREVDARVASALTEVGLDPALAARRPHEFSGGQCQRIAIARAAILRPKVIVCDEPVSALDVSVQGQIVNLLADLRRTHGTALVFISHNLAVVRHLCDRVLVMYGGRVVEQADREALYERPAHPYTRLLLDAVPSADPVRERARPPAPGAEPAGDTGNPGGCAFRPRCRYAVERCAAAAPALDALGPGRYAACVRARELAAEASGG